MLQQSNDDDDDDDDDDDVSGLVCVLEELERRNWSAGDRASWWKSFGTGGLAPRRELVSSCANFDQGAPFINNFEVKLGTVDANCVLD